MCVRRPSFPISLLATTVSSQARLRLSPAGPSRIRRKKYQQNRLASLGSCSSNSSMSLLSPLLSFSSLSPSPQLLVSNTPRPPPPTWQHNTNNTIQPLPKTRRRQTREETAHSHSSRDDTIKDHQLSLLPAAWCPFLLVLRLFLDTSWQLSLPLVLLSFSLFTLFPF